MKYIVTILSLLMILLTVGCADEKPPQRNLVLEVAASLGDLYDAKSNRADELFGRYCSVCHGLTGKGDGFNAYNVDPKPRDFTDSAFVVQLSPALIIESITDGGKAVGLSGLMPPWGKTLDSVDIRLLAQKVINFGSQSQNGARKP